MFNLAQTDPGVPIVYAGFGALMLTTCVSFLSHLQVKILSTLAIDAFIIFIKLSHDKLTLLLYHIGVGFSRRHEGGCWRKV